MQEVEIRFCGPVKGDSDQGLAQDFPQVRQLYILPSSQVYNCVMSVSIYPWSARRLNKKEHLKRTFFVGSPLV